MRLTQRYLRAVCTALTPHIQGHASEKILRTALAIKLREDGFVCHEEVVLPVLHDGYFVGHNRIDILVHRIDGRTRKASYVAALELKTIRDSLLDEQRTAECTQQSTGYMRCLQHVFSASKTFDVYTVNFRRPHADVEIVAQQHRHKGTRRA
tara:strand:+ start:1741 stop:2196 length:456 start_codon:yes stop_codon:yes gene_type:complete